MNTASDQLSRIQSESRIPASTWRQWCTRLDLDPDMAVELWDEVGHPLTIASGRAPDAALLLHLRALRPDLYIDDFRQELPAIWQSLAFVEALQAQEAGLADARPALLKLYRHLGSQSPASPAPTRVVAHVGTLVLLCAVRPDQFSPARLVRVLTSGKATFEDLTRLARRSLPQDDYGDTMAAAFDAAADLLVQSAGPVAGGPATDDNGDDDTEPVADDAPDSGETADTEPVDEDPAEAEPTEIAGEIDDDEDEEDDPADTPAHPYDRFLDALRLALSTALAGDDHEDAQVRGQRLLAIQNFDPLSSHVPSMEEARMALTAGPATRRGRGPVLTARRSASGGTVVSTSTGGGRASGVPRRSGGGPRPAARPVGSPASVGGQVRRAEGAVATAVAVDVDGRLVTPSLRRDQLDEAVQQVAAGLGKVKELDERVWQLLCEPEAEIEDPRRLAEDLAADESAAVEAAEGLRLAAQQQRLRAILEVPPDRRLNERRFDLELEAFLNSIRNSRRELEPDARQLIPLPKILDHAAAGLLRVEALRAAVVVVREAGDDPEPSAEAAGARFEELLGDITYLAGRPLMEQARARADADVAAVLAAVAADAWIERVCAASLDYARVVAQEAASAAQLAEILVARPLVLEPPPGHAELPGAFPEALAADTPLGEFVDTLRVAVLRAAWQALRDEHRPRETAERLDADLRRALRAQARLTPRRERHENNPRVALPVTSLEKLSGNPELAHLFVRLTTDGRLLFVEDFEDGACIDLFERRESTKRQMHARARERALTSRTGELQTGSHYLHSVGRTRDPFARTEAEVMAARVVDDDGEPVIFDLF